MCLIKTLLMRVANRTNNNLCSDITPEVKDKRHVKGDDLKSIIMIQQQSSNQLHSDSVPTIFVPDDANI